MDADECHPCMSMSNESHECGCPHNPSSRSPTPTYRTSKPCINDDEGYSGGSTGTAIALIFKGAEQHWISPEGALILHLLGTLGSC